MKIKKEKISVFSKTKWTILNVSVAIFFVACPFPHTTWHFFCFA